VNSHACEDRPLQPAKSRFFQFTRQERELKAGGHPKSEGWAGWAGRDATRQRVEASRGVTLIQGPARSKKLTLGGAASSVRARICPFGGEKEAFFSRLQAGIILDPTRSYLP